jgi:predicted permease
VASVLDVALPFFAVIFAGYASLRWGLLDRASVLGLNAFVFYVSLPALLLTKVSTAPVESQPVR